MSSDELVAGVSLGWVKHGCRVGKQQFGEMDGDIYCAANFLPDGRKFYYCRQRYVLGKGHDFHGVWDRLTPEAPLGRFSKDGMGWRESRRMWADLMNGLPLEEVVVVGSRAKGR